MVKRLYRSGKDKVIAGVCGGIAEYFDVDPVLIRLAAVGLLFAGIGIIVYIVAWIIVPKNPAHKW
jgi:phage shock protein C